MNARHISVPPYSLPRARRPAVPATLSDGRRREGVDMEQLNLLDMAYARRRDPHTAHEAARSVSVTDLESVVLEALRALGPSTSHEVAAYTGLDLVTVSPRFKPLETKGLVKRKISELHPDRVVYETRVGKSGRASVVWHLV